MNMKYISYNQWKFLSRNNKNMYGKIVGYITYDKQNSREYEKC
jgi:hypothetical protein